MPHLDLDAALIEKIGRSIPDYFEKWWKRLSRELETNFVLSKMQPSFQLGAGLLSDQKSVVLKSFQQVIVLHATPEELLKESRRYESQRPMYERSSKNRYFV